MDAYPDRRIGCEECDALDEQWTDDGGCVKCGSCGHCRICGRYL